MPVPQLIDRLTRAAGRIGRGAAIGSAWQIVRASIQLLWVILVARLLGPGEYGLFAGLVGLAATIGTMTGLGLGLVLLLDVPRDPAGFSAAWARSLFVYIASGVLLIGVFVMLAPGLTGHDASLFVLAAIGLSDILCLPLAALCSYSFQAHERMGWAQSMYVVAPAASLCAVLVYSHSGSEPALATYVAYHASAALVATFILLGIVRRTLRPTATRPQYSSAVLQRGMELSLTRGAEFALTNLDRTLVLRLGGPDLAATYSVATRLATTLALPAVALCSSAIPMLSRVSDRSPDIHRALVRKLLLAAVGVGTLAALAMPILGQLLVWALGVDFQASSQFAARLALLPLLLGLTSLGCTVLLASGRHRLRLAIQSAGLTFLFIPGMYLISNFDAAGAAAMVIGAQVLTAAGLWFAIRSTASGISARH